MRSKSVVDKVPAIISVSPPTVADLERFLHETPQTFSSYYVLDRLNLLFSKFIGNFQIYQEDLKKTTSCHKLDKLSQKQYAKLLKGDKFSFSFKLTLPLKYEKLGADEVLLSSVENHLFSTLFKDTEKGRVADYLMGNVESEYEGLNLKLRQANPNHYAIYTRDILKNHGYCVKDNEIVQMESGLVPLISTS